MKVYVVCEGEYAYRTPMAVYPSLEAAMAAYPKVKWVKSFGQWWWARGAAVDITELKMEMSA